MNESARAASLRHANRRLALRLGAGAVVMFAFCYALAPLYEVFCRATGANGFNGRTANAARATAVDTTRWVTVEFNGDVMPGLPWRFEPRLRQMRVHPGAQTSAMYRVTNIADRAVVGRAVPSVTPPQAARHFSKTECFCFSQQRLEAGETRDMPVTFVVNPELPPEVRVLTLSYAFFPNDGANDESAAAQGVKNW